MIHDLSAYSFLPAYDIANRVNVALADHNTLVITAPPGAGKSTLLPLTMLEAVPDGQRIIMLEPRRLAARQIAERMAEMLGEEVGQTVGYRVRMDNKVSARTRIEVVTEGILTRMMISDATLDDVALIIFDEFHERSVQSDVALALVRETQSILRDDLKVVIMSATIDAEAICNTLQAPLIESQGRLFPIEVKRWKEEADARSCVEVVTSCIRQALREEEGDILAFLPGQYEIQRCQEALASSHSSGSSISREDSISSTSNISRSSSISSDSSVSRSSRISSDTPSTPPLILPLYGNLPFEEQRAAILPRKDGRRRVVLATPIAETSLTIEGVRIVVDSGLCRTLVYDAKTGLSHLETTRISLDMARQRMGRAGRLTEGVCYQLWSLATEHRMADCRPPEILSTDMAGVILDIMAWGESDVLRLPWMTHPPREAIYRALDMLLLLGAIEEVTSTTSSNKKTEYRLTTLGKRLSNLPCHPRIAKMLLDKNGALAADIAALLEERDPMAQADDDADITSRIIALRETRRRKKAGHYVRIIKVAEQYRRLIKANEDNDIPAPEEVGRLVASAYPERVAHHEGNGRFRMATGDEVFVTINDALSAHEWIAIASVSQRIFLAAPVEKSDLLTMAKERDNLSWDSKQGQLRAQHEWRMGNLLIDSRPLQQVPQEAVTAILCEAAKKDGLSMFNFDEDVHRLQQRVACVAQWHDELALPDVSDAAFLDRAAEWLPFYMGKATTTQALKRINLTEAIWSLLSYEQQLAVDQLAPTHITVPTGSRIRVDYRPQAQAPVVSVRLQECFGLTDTPLVNDGRQPVLMELLSPGFKPVQLTQDLRNFWQDTYFEVRKELRRRYPKHSWPDNPLEASPTRGVKKKN